MKYLKTFCKLFYGRTNKEEELSYALMLLFLIPLLELLLHILIVYFIPDKYLICNWKTVIVFFENAGCANNTIGFWFYIIQPIISIFFAYKYLVNNIGLYENYEKGKWINKYGLEIKIMSFSFVAVFVQYLFIIFFDPYKAVFRSSIGNPRYYPGEFLFDFMWLVGTHLAMLFFFLMMFLLIFIFLKHVKLR